MSAERIESPDATDAAVSPHPMRQESELESRPSSSMLDDTADDDALDKPCTDVIVGYGPTLNGHAVPMMDDAGDYIAVANKNTYVPLGMWIYKAVGAKYSYRSRFVATNIGVQITNGINNAMGRHTRSSWFVDKDRQPLISTLAVPIDGVTFHIKPGRKMCVKYSAEVITKLGQMALADKQGKLLAEEKQRKTTVRHDLTSYALAALDETDLMHLKKSKIKWQPSKLRFLVGTGRTATAHSTNLSKRVRNKCKGNPNALKNKLIAKVLRVKDKLCGDYSTDTDDESVDDATDNGSDDSGTPSNE